MSLSLTVLFLFGHLALWIALFNRCHALGLSCRQVRFVELVLILLAVSGLTWTVQESMVDPSWFLALVMDAQRGTVGNWSLWLLIYVLGCCSFGGWVIVQWAQRQGWRIPAARLLANHTESVDVARQLGHYPMRGWSTRLFAYLPMNEMFDLHVQTKAIAMPQLPAELEGLSILHLSDLHFTGKITRPFFDYVMDRAAGLEAELAVITGDILESEQCFEWLPETLGRIRCPHGVYFILGNHDQRVDNGERLRRELTGLGFIDVGRASRVIEIQGQSVLLSGNELPWFGPLPELPELPDDGGGRQSLRILLSHSPDQLPWARRRGFDLMLAGHTHGGHIRLPLAGPLVCPSRFGVRYASGLFHEPPTVLHVSRGISGLDPLRFNCPPEVTRLILQRGA